MAENNAKNYEGGTKGLGSVKTRRISRASKTDGTFRKTSRAHR